jgi:hypothetical protein
MTAPTVVDHPDLAALPATGLHFVSLASEARRVPPPSRFLFGPVSAAMLTRYFAQGTVLAVAYTYGHWLTEFLPKLGLLAAAGHDVDALSYPLPEALPPFARD